VGGEEEDVLCVCARRRFESQARQSPALRALALGWQERLAAMTELSTGQQPSPNVWKRIEIALRNEEQVRPAAAPSRPRGLAFWRGAALAGGFAAVFAFTFAVWTGSRLDAQPEIRYVAMLQGDQANPEILVTFDARHGTLTLKRLGQYQEGEGRSLQLWALPPSGGPRSLGVLERGKVMKLTTAPGEVRQVPALAISLEPEGGAPQGSGPTGPVLFKGALVPTT
jgi:anti-sigma-K factor RskA